MISGSTAGRRIAGGAAALLLAASGAWAADELAHGGALSSYEGLAPAHNLQTRAEWRADVEALKAAQTARIAPVTVQPAGAEHVTAQQSALIANELARTLCARLGSHFRMVPFRSPADLTVHATITSIRPTNTYAASASMGARVVASVVGSPVAPRVPVGLGALSAEAEAVDRGHVQRAALVWDRSANALLTRARVSHIGDAYQLAAAFAGDMARLVITGEDPLRDLTLPAVRHKAPQAACGIYGRGERSGYVSGFFGVAPEATDQGAGPDKPSPR